MNRRSNTEKIERYSLVKFDIDQQTAIYATDLLQTSETICVGAHCSAFFKGAPFSAVILAMNGMFLIKIYFSFSFLILYISQVAYKKNAGDI